MPSQRLFIALSPPDPVRAVVAGIMKPLRNVHWTPVDQIHVTLRFLGEVSDENVSALADCLSPIRVEPFLLPVEGAGVFPSQRTPRVLWVGIGLGHPRLHQLRQRIDDALIGAGLEIDLRTFHPHITVARSGESAANAVKQWLNHHRDFVGPPFVVDAFDLFASELKGSGAVHRIVRRFPLEK